MEGFIFLSDVLRIMAMVDEQGNFIPFSITFITCNLTEETGGKRMTCDNVTLAGHPFGKKNSPKNANHWMNGTRNMLIPGRPRPTTVHNVLITRFNGERVII
ncbi:hypothetical protein J3L18_05335 [Mucilaginibacter gossypii]|uniref:hypothetical protein n=1 Tax=Mucilaginibacter gossypii TaxID=551996 RepID=UPI000DCE6A8D|nr:MULTISPECIES: hypothetical protein [Mucilaginibacter]QTE38501.1 hypothetical protein J3L18_05335 [Mucilaginibacter gossypii]RAV55762.1 hypothetical protein DIU36_16860 [Mucilaginibacter rubeus]